MFQDLFTKWPMVYPIPDQRSERIVKILVDPFCGVPEALLSDRGANLLSHLMRDVCELLGTKKLNTTAYHPQCDGLVERYNRTLKTALRKHVARFGVQWDRFLSGIVWAYRNTPLMRNPRIFSLGSTAVLRQKSHFYHPQKWSYREELILLLSSARELAAQSIQQAQKKYKTNYDLKAHRQDNWVGEWVLFQPMRQG